MRKLVLITTGDDEALLRQMEEAFLHHLALFPHATVRLGKVESLAVAYDQAARSVGDQDAVLLFCHQDAKPLLSPGRYETLSSLPSWMAPAFHDAAGWVRIVQHLADRDDTGLMGVAGAGGLIPGTAWWHYPDLHGAVAHNSGGDSLRINPYGVWGRVAVLDGLCLIIKRETMINLPPSSKKLTGFHYYDMELSMRCLASGLKNWTIPLLLLHESGGADTRDPQWLTDRLAFERIYADDLPVHVPWEPLPNAGSDDEG